MTLSHLFTALGHLSNPVREAESSCTIPTRELESAQHSSNNTSPLYSYGVDLNSLNTPRESKMNVPTINIRPSIIEFLSVVPNEETHVSALRQILYLYA